MKTKLVILLMLLNLVSVNLNSQKVISPIKYRFPRGQDGFLKYAFENIAYPDSSKFYWSFGFSISSISITPKGEIAEIKIINPVDKFIDAEVVKLLEGTKGRWIKCDSIEKNQTFYVQIAFKFNFANPRFCESKSVPYRYLFLEPIVVTAMTFQEPTRKVFDDQTLAEAGNNMLNEGRYREALLVINELIKRDPFNRELYKIRILVNSNLGRIELVKKDSLMLTNFAEGYSIDEIVKTN